MHRGERDPYARRSFSAIAEARYCISTGLPHIMTAQLSQSLAHRRMVNITVLTLFRIAPSLQLTNNVNEKKNELKGTVRLVKTIARKTFTSCVSSTFVNFMRSEGAQQWQSFDSQKKRRKEIA